MEGSHSLRRCEEVTGALFEGLCEQGVSLECMLLKPNMVIPGTKSSHPASVQEVAEATLRCFRQHVPVAVQGIVFLLGGQEEQISTVHLNAINQQSGRKPWRISFSCGRVLQDPALEAWHSRDEGLKAPRTPYTIGPGAMGRPVGGILR